MDFTEDDQSLISAHPIGGRLDHLRDILPQARDDQAISLPTLINALEKEQTHQDVHHGLLDVLAALLSHPVSKQLRSVSTKALSTDIATIYARLSDTNKPNLEPFLPLLKPLIQRDTSDLEIWQAVKQLIVDFNEQTQPRLIKASQRDNLITHSSASIQNPSEQTRNLLRPEIIYELKNCTCSPVEGFFAKHFEQRAWTQQSQEIYQSIKDSILFPDKPTQDNVLKWWFDFQEAHLSSASGIYYTTSSTREVIPAPPYRQLDILLKPRGASKKSPHDWKDVQVVGELTQSKKDTCWTEKFIQLAIYVRDIFSAQPTRRFVHGFLLFGHEMELWIFDRSGAYGTDSFDIQQDQKKFIQVVVGYAFMDDEELGVDTFIRRARQKRSVSLNDLSSGKQVRFNIGKTPIFVQQAIVCRGTSCYRTSARKKKRLVHEHVIKFSWTAETAKETEYLQLARERGVQGVAIPLGSSSITSIAALRDGLRFLKQRQIGKYAKSGMNVSSQPSTTYGTTSFFQRLSMKRSAEDDSSQLTLKKQKISPETSKLRQEINQEATPKVEEFRNRILRCTAISPAGRPLREFSSPVTLLKSLRDCIRAHFNLFSRGRILHRDISENNLVITDPSSNNGFSGMLIDLDLAVEVGEDGRNMHRGAHIITGTRQFMAIEVLEGVDHTYRHDLESFFYVLIWVSVSYGWESEQTPKFHPLRDWYNNGFAELAKTRRGCMVANGFDLYVLTNISPLFNGIKPLLRRLRDLLFSDPSNGFNIGTPNAPASDLYEVIIGEFDNFIKTMETENQDRAAQNKNRQPRTKPQRLRESPDNNVRRSKRIERIRNPNA